jgi:hypothetical protein
MYYNSWTGSTFILNLLKNKIIVNFVIFVDFFVVTGQRIFPLFCYCYQIRDKSSPDPGSEKNNPDPQHCSNWCRFTTLRETILAETCVVDLHWLQCWSGSRIIGQCGSGSGSCILRQCGSESGIWHQCWSASGILRHCWFRVLIIKICKVCILKISFAACSKVQSGSWFKWISGLRPKYKILSGKDRIRVLTTEVDTVRTVKWGNIVSSCHNENFWPVMIIYEEIHLLLKLKTQAGPDDNIHPWG